jgi:hypothetical protein
MNASMKLRLPFAASTLALSAAAFAVPVNGVYIEDGRCENLPNWLLTHELGDALTFPANEAIVVNVIPTPFLTVCVPDDGIANDFLVQITNVSGSDWVDLYFVGDLGMQVGNADGALWDTAPLPGAITDAFRIDGTVTAGINNNLLFESIFVDEIFQNGERWDFKVDNFMHPSGVVFPPIIMTPGVFANSDPVVTPPLNTASILANPIPEPGLVGLAAVLGGAILLRRRR